MQTLLCMSLARTFLDFVSAPSTLGKIQFFGPMDKVENNNKCRGTPKMEKF